LRYENGDPKVADFTKMVEHLENSSPLLIAEIKRWNDIIGDDYLHYKYKQEQPLDKHTPTGLHPQIKS
jgi:hypothetical protein